MLGLGIPSTVPVRDEGGRVRRMPLTEWRTFFLPEAMARRWTEPDELARLVECALDVGMHADVLTSADHLSRIDPDRERRYGLPAIALARNGQFSRAEELLDRHDSLYGVTTYGLYARAEVSLSGNRRARGQELLLQSLEIDPDSSPSLRRFVEEMARDGEAAVDAAVRSIASVPGSWRAKLWLASSLTVTLDEVPRLVRAAVEQSRDEREVLAVASSVLARRGLTRSLVDFIAPRYQIDRDRLACGVNLLFGFLAAGRKVPGEALLQRLEPRLEAAGLEDFASFYRTGFQNLRDLADAEDVQGPKVELLKAMADAARRDSDKARRRCWQLLAKAYLLVPVTRAWMEIPIFDSSWPSTHELLELVTGVDSEGRDVALAFTDERTLRAWGPMRTPCVAIGMRALLEIVAWEKGCSVLVNPAGPTATELALPDIEAFLDGRAPTGEESRIRFLAAPLRREVPDGFLETAGEWLSESGVAREAWLFEMVDDRRGVNPAVAVEFLPDTSPRDIRELLIDAADEIRWDSRRSRRVRMLELEENAFARYVRAVGVPVPGLAVSDDA